VTYSERIKRLRRTRAPRHERAGVEPGISREMGLLLVVGLIGLVVLGATLGLVNVDPILNLLSRIIDWFLSS
jgi:hypothetical protein